MQEGGLDAADDENKGGIHRGLRPTSDMRRWAPLQITITDVGRLFINRLATRRPPSDGRQECGTLFSPMKGRQEEWTDGPGSFLVGAAAAILGGGGNASVRRL